MALDTAQHTSLLVQILKDISTDPLVGPLVGFKGGTAAFLLYNLSRASVDLDFDLLDASKEKQVFEQINKILSSYGIVKKADNKYHTLFFLLSYHNKLKDAQNIKVEINKRSFESRYELKQYLGIPLTVMVPEDMAANKLVAMYNRLGKANRDIFDVWFFLKNDWPINEKIVEARTGMSYKKFLQQCINSLEKLSDRNILSGIGELLDTKQKVWAKQHLRKDTILLLKIALEDEKRSHAQ